MLRDIRVFDPVSTSIKGKWLQESLELLQVQYTP
jgi:hypothetical protein